MQHSVLPGLGENLYEAANFPANTAPGLEVGRVCILPLQTVLPAREQDHPEAESYQHICGPVHTYHHRVPPAYRCIHSNTAAFHTFLQLQAGWQQAMAAWYDKEAPNYSYAAPSYGDGVGHFTQVACSWCRLRCRMSSGFHSARPLRLHDLDPTSRISYDQIPKRRSKCQCDVVRSRAVVSHCYVCKSTDCLGVNDGSGLRPRGRLRSGRRPRCRVGAGPVRLQVQPAWQQSMEEYAANVHPLAALQADSSG